MGGSFCLFLFLSLSLSSSLYPPPFPLPFKRTNTFQLATYGGQRPHARIGDQATPREGHVSEAGRLFCQESKGRVGRSSTRKAGEAGEADVLEVRKMRHELIQNHQQLPLTLKLITAKR